MDDKTKSQEQVETKNEINKEESKIKRKKVNPLFIVLALFVLFSLIPVIGYLLFKYTSIIKEYSPLLVTFLSKSFLALGE